MNVYIVYLLITIILYQLFFTHKEEPLQMKLICKKIYSETYTTDDILSCTYDDFMADLKLELNNDKAYNKYTELKGGYNEQLKSFNALTI